MLNSSKSFKEKIKSPTRQILGYVEVLYDEDEKIKSNYDFIGADDEWQFGYESDVFDGIRVDNNYAIINRDSILLDGSFCLPSTNYENPSFGYVTNWLYTGNEWQITDENNGYRVLDSDTSINCYIQLKENGIAQKINGITIYFGESIPIKFDVVINNNKIEINENNYKNYYLDDKTFYYEIETELNDIHFQFYKLLKSEHRLQIDEIDFGISRVYSNDTLIDLKVNEQVDMINAETPTNECTITFVAEKEFDILNPKNYIPFIQKGAVVKPYIGQNTANGREFIPCGIFYTYEYKKNNDGTTTLNSQSILRKFAEEEFTTKTSNIRNIFNSKSAFENWLISTYDNYNFKLDEYIFQNNMPLATYLRKDLSAISFLQYKALCCRAFFKENRYNQIMLKEISKNSLEHISKEECVDNIQITSKNAIEGINIIHEYKIANDYAIGEELAKTFTYTSINEIEYIKITTDLSFERYRFNQNGANMVTLLTGYDTDYGYVNFFNDFMVLKVESDIGSKITINVVSGDTAPSTKTTITDSKHERNIYLNNNPKNIIEIKTPTFDNDRVHELIKNNIFDFATDKKITLETYGDPTLEAGDCIDIETDYGNKKMIITSLEINYDGGLSESIEGELYD